MLSPNAYMRLNEVSEAAFKEMYEGTTALAWHYANNFNITFHEKESAIEDAYVDLFKSVQNGKRYNSNAHFESTLSISVNNRCINRFNDYNRFKNFQELPDNVELEEEVPYDYDNDVRYEGALKLIQWHIRKLPGKCRKIVRLSYLQHKSLAEIGDIMGISRQTILNQRNRGIKILTESLQKSKQGKGYFIK